MNALLNAHTKRGCDSPPHIGLTSNVSPPSPKLTNRGVLGLCTAGRLRLVCPSCHLQQGKCSRRESKEEWYKDIRATKVTISSADIPYIQESVLHLYSLGIHEVNINCVFENVWKEGDDILFEEQLLQLADAIIDGDYYKDYACSFYSESIGKPLDRELENQNWCGAGRMLSIDAAGNFYPCTRFAQYSLRDKKTWIIGNVNDGIDKNKLRPFLILDRCTQSNTECIDCEVASGCAWCQGENYDAADTPTINQRAIAICKMHKARVRANNYYWNKLYRKLELEGIAKEEAKGHVKKSNSNNC